ncbi:MAG: hypothetical protein LUC85_00530 [Bacteroidales bacterium]|nr:hypothetical protein [Bacteroidales bacterium]
MIDPKSGFDLHCSAYPCGSAWAPENSAPRYWVQLGHDIVWDFPKAAPLEELREMGYPYANMALFSDFFRGYIDCPVADLPAYGRANPRWGLFDLIYASDRRIGRAKIVEMASTNPIIARIYANRFDSQPMESTK